MFPQLRVRTEYSFRTCYGPVSRVADRLARIETPAAGIVDTKGTWGHVDWQKHLNEQGIKPLFGCEFALPREDQLKPVWWALAEDLRLFYRASSTPPTTAQEIAQLKGVVRFAGAALTDPECFDYIDINPRSRRRAQQAIALARRTNKPLVITSDNDYPSIEDRHRFLAWDDSSKMTPQHILTLDELRYSMSYIDDDTWAQAVRNTHEVAERCAGQSLGKAPIISVPGDLRQLVEEGKAERLRRGHIAQWTDEYEKRLVRELDMIEQKEFESYFIAVADMINWAKQRMLVGPARGSSAGSLVCYLLRITEVDPLVHGLIFERFIDVNRADLPDIDVDFNDQKRELVFEYLANKYGVDKTARIGSINRLKPRSVIAHVAKKLGIPRGVTFNVTNVLIEYSSGDSRYGHALSDTLQGTQPGKDFVLKYPEARVMTQLEEHASHTGVHAAGFIVSNVPLVELCTVRDGVAQLDKKAAEQLGMLKIDVLGLRTLGVIEDSGCITSEQLYDLSLDDPEVLAVFNNRKFSGLFQFEGEAQRRVSVQIPIKEFQQIDHITALARPGPLGGGAANTYINRNAGREPVVYRHPSMANYLGETFGVVLYQEQVMRIVREVGQFSWEETSTIRKAMSGRKGKEYFDRRGDEFVTGAISTGLTAEEARTIWGEIVTFGAWGMNKSHTVSYAMISYWCAHMKAHHPLEYAAALLRNAKDDSQTIEMLRELRSEGVRYTPFDLELSQHSWSVQDGMLVGGFQNLVGVGPVKATALVAKRDTGKLTEKDRAFLASAKVKHDDLNPAHTLWSHIYNDPESFNVHGRIKQFAELQDGENAVIICQLVRLDRRDENESVRVHKRGYARKGQTLFVDAFVVDDSVSKPLILRLRPEHWFAYGQKMADRAVPGKDWFLVRGKWLGQFNMLTMTKIKCLTNEEMFI